MPSEWQKTCAANLAAVSRWDKGNALNRKAVRFWRRRLWWATYGAAVFGAIGAGAGVAVALAISRLLGW